MPPPALYERPGVVSVWVGDLAGPDAAAVVVTLDVVPDEDHPYAVLAARDDAGALLGEARVAADFRLGPASASAWVDSGFRRPG